MKAIANLQKKTQNRTIKGPPPKISINKVEYIRTDLVSFKRICDNCKFSSCSPGAGGCKNCIDHGNHKYQDWKKQK
jgi:hypothetical protein